MKINIKPVTLEDGTVCSEGRLSAALSDSVAIRVVPVDPDGVEHPEATQSVVGGPDDYAVAAFQDVIKPYFETLIKSKV